MNGGEGVRCAIAPPNCEVSGIHPLGQRNHYMRVRAKSRTCASTIHDNNESCMCVYTRARDPVAMCHKTGPSTVRKKNLASAAIRPMFLALLHVGWPAKAARAAPPENGLQGTTGWVLPPPGAGAGRASGPSAPGPVSPPAVACAPPHPRRQRDQGPPPLHPQHRLGRRSPLNNNAPWPAFPKTSILMSSDRRFPSRRIFAEVDPRWRARCASAARDRSSTTSPKTWLARPVAEKGPEKSTNILEI